MNELTKGSTLQHGKYEIVKTLGKGSFGITYLAATNAALSGVFGQMNVAIKEFFMDEFNKRSRDGSSVDGSSSSLVKNYRKKFHREADNLSKLHHPNIVKVYEVFDENNTTYYAMEYVEGESLNDYIKSKGRIPETEVIEQLQEIGAALKHMHDNKMLHLDLKPSNIMRNKEGHLLLIDFGLSKQYNQNGEPESSTTLGLGTPGYAPMEQANYKQDGTFPATLDIYALGATLYKMLTGSTPLHAFDIYNNGFPDDLFLKLGISTKTTAMVRKAMSPTKKQRFQTVSELLKEAEIPITPPCVNEQEDVEVVSVEEKTSIYADILSMPDSISISVEYRMKGYGFTFDIPSDHSRAIVTASPLHISGKREKIEDEYDINFDSFKRRFEELRFLESERWEKSLSGTLTGMETTAHIRYGWNGNAYSFVRTEKSYGDGPLVKALERLLATEDVLCRMISLVKAIIN